MSWEKKVEAVFELLDVVRDLPHFIGFSGGKDSTTVLDLYAHYLMERYPYTPVYIVYNETWLDPPPIRRWVYSHLAAVEEWARKNRFNVNILVTKPPPGKDFFSLVLGRGYSLPVVRSHAPWCNKEMKSRPTRRLIRKIMRENNYNEIVYVTGSRLSESAKRKRSLMKQNQYTPLVYASIEYLGKQWLLAPIYDWTSEEVLEYLRANIDNVFGESYKPLLELYEKYGEKKTKLRSGCWICPQVVRDQFLEAYARDHPEYKIVLEARKKIIEISENPRYREATTRNGNLAGRLTVEGRKKIAEILCRLLETRVGRELMKDYVENTLILQLLMKYCSLETINRIS